MPVVVALLVVGLVAVAVAAPRIAENRARTDKTAQCRALQQRLAGARVQGGDLNETTKIEAQLRACVADAQALGEQIDTSMVTLEIARGMNTQIVSEWGHYQRTNYTDAVKRNNTRGTILRIGGELVRTLRQAVQEATTIDAIDAISALALEVARGSYDRGVCFDAGAAGCGRFAVNESTWHERALEEWAAMLYPIVGVVPDRPEERRAIWLRVRPLWESVGVSPDWVPRLARRGPDYGGITVEQVPALRAAGSDSVLALIRARRVELQPPAANVLNASSRAALVRALGTNRLRIPGI